MTDKKKPGKATIKLSGDGLWLIFNALDQRAKEAVDRCREYPGNKPSLSNFKEALADLVEALTALVGRPVDGESDCWYQPNFDNAGRIVAYAEHLPLTCRQVFYRLDVLSREIDARAELSEWIAGAA